MTPFALYLPVTDIGRLQLQSNPSREQKGSCFEQVGGYLGAYCIEMPKKLFPKPERVNLLQPRRRRGCVSFWHLFKLRIMIDSKGGQWRLRIRLKAWSCSSLRRLSLFYFDCTGDSVTQRESVGDSIVGQLFIKRVLQRPR
jgi:hypothetical protein